MALTKYKEGSTRELLHLAWPLMLSSLSFALMLACDRLFLSHYSLEAMNAAVIGGTFAWALQDALRVIAGMAEVFVAQYNGARRFKEIGPVVWQMIWFSLFCGLFFIGFSLWGLPFVLKSGPGRDFAFICLLFGGFSPLLAALSAYYIGQGKIKLIIMVALLANCLNVLFDLVLIFGIKGIIPPLGSNGAAIATNLGQVIEAIVLFTIFLKTENRQKHFTHIFKFHFPLFIKCVYMGMPLALAIFLEITGVWWFYDIMAATSVRNLTIASFWQTILIMFWFVGEGMGQAATAVAGNLIGAKKKELIALLLKKAFKFYILITVFSFLVLIFIPQEIWKGLLQIMNISEAIMDLKTLFFVASVALIDLFLVWIRYFINGILIAAGDTMFQLIVGPLVTWLLFLLPVCIAVKYYNYGIEAALLLAVMSSVISILIFYSRYKFGPWRKKEII